MSSLDEIGMHAGASAEIFHKAAMLRRKMTAPEKILWDNLEFKPLNIKFRRQHPFGLYVLDFYCHQKRLCIEIDGKSHENKFQKQYDIERTKFIESFGIRVLRFNNEELLHDHHNVVEIILLQMRTDTLNH